MAHLVGEHLFAEWWSVVGGVGFITDCGDWAKVAESSKGFCGSQSTHGRANDDDRLGHELPIRA
jgi:hypothetical protein